MAAGPVGANPPQCRFCLEPATNPANPFIEPCCCSGSVRYVHTNCLRRWIALDPGRNSQRCTICATPFKLRVFPALEEVPPAADGWRLFFLTNSGTVGCALQLIYYAALSSNEQLLTRTSLVTAGFVHEVFILLFLRNAGIQNWRLYMKEARKNGVATVVALHLFLLSIAVWGERPAYTFPTYFLLDIYWNYHTYTLRGVNALVLEDIRAAAGAGF